MSTKSAGRKTIEVARKRVPLKKLLHGKEIREAAKALEDFRMNLNEAEFLYGAKIHLTMDSYGECTAVAKRPETESEWKTRLEKERAAAEAKLEREKKRKLIEAEKARYAEENKKKEALQHIKNFAKHNNLTHAEIETFLGTSS